MLDSMCVKVLHGTRVSHVIFVNYIVPANMALLTIFKATRVLKSKH